MEERRSGGEEERRRGGVAIKQLLEDTRPKLCLGHSILPQICLSKV